MYWDVITVKPLPDFRIDVEIADGRKGISQTSKVFHATLESSKTL
jgi:hypothetical protein